MQDAWKYVYKIFFHQTRQMVEIILTYDYNEMKHIPVHDENAYNGHIFSWFPKCKLK